MSADSERISLQDAAKILGVSVDTVRRRVADGSLPAERIGTRLLRVRRDNVETLLRPVPTVDSAS